MLSEEIFEYSSGQMTQDKIMVMKRSLNNEFTAIYQLCEYVLDNSQDIVLLNSTLKTLKAFLYWIPVGYIFETKLIQTLALKFFPVPAFQTAALECLSEIAGLQLPDHPEYNPRFVAMFQAVIAHVSKLLPDDLDLGRVHSQGEQAAREFLNALTIFITTMIKAHLNLLETGDETTQRALYASLLLLLRLSRIPDVEVFKICLECWSGLVIDLYNTQKIQAPASVVAPTLLVGTFTPPTLAPRVKQYSEILSHLRRVLISRMAKPEEVLIVEDENGEIVRETQPDTDAITLYKTMRECLIYLTHLDPIDTQEIMLAKLAKQVDGTEYSWNNLNTLCWAIGATSGALSETAEKNFLVKVIKALLGLCEKKRGKDHKAVIASNIMYVVGQYPRFLRQHWKFLKTVVNKLFEFMHEKHPGVQDMSVDTFLKIARKCRRKFVVLQKEERRPFIEEIIENLPRTIKDLEQSQIHTFYEACGEIIASEQDPNRRQQLIYGLMQLPNQSWTQIVVQAQNNVNVLWELNTVKAVVLVLKTNHRAAMALKHAYIVQLSRIYKEMLQIYRMYSQFVSQKIAQEGPRATQTVLVRSMRAVKKEVLKLMQTFVNNCEEQDKEIVFNQFLPALLEPVLQDYKQSVPEARDHEVLNLMAAIVEKIQLPMVPVVPLIFEATFESTLSMISKNLADFPDHRVAFFKLLQNINAHCFPALLKLTGQQFQLVMDSIIWAVKHIERTVAETGLTILLDLLTNIERSEVANDFYRQYFIPLVQDILGVLTDTLHKPGFPLQATILAKLFHIVESGAITQPLWVGNPNLPPGVSFPNNQTYVRQFVVNLLRKSFATVTQSQVEQFVAGLFALNTRPDQFKTHIRDFLIQLKEFNVDGADNSDLYLEERRKAEMEQRAREEERIKSVPGLAYVGLAHQIRDDDDMD